MALRKSFRAMLTINDCTLDQKNDGTDVQADGDDNFEHNAFLFGAKVNPACAKPLRKKGRSVAGPQKLADLQRPNAQKHDFRRRSKKK